MPSKTAQFLTQATRAATPQPTPGETKSANIRGLYQQGIRNIRSDRNMHAERRKVEAARLYTTTRAALRKVLKEQHAADDDAFPKLERKLWGFDLERATATNKASLDTTIRDAQDRAAGIRKQADAARMLAQAEQAGDAILARAIGKRAHDMDWDDVVADYLSTRPSSAKVYAEAGAIHARRTDMQSRMHMGMQAALAKPEELHGMSDDDITRMAADPADAAA
ncbi:hypothetical protein [Streptomyces boninensis]|uniref:hypothetical protein n=1 Tax=Streptomyces boninensis TaxID=2039455 RepID=UPI003B20EB95